MLNRTLTAASSRGCHAVSGASLRRTQPRRAPRAAAPSHARKSELNGRVVRAQHPEFRASSRAAPLLSCEVWFLIRHLTNLAPPKPHLPFHRTQLPPSASSASGTGCLNIFLDHASTFLPVFISMSPLPSLTPLPLSSGLPASPHSNFIPAGGLPIS